MFDDALDKHRQGQYVEAERLYQRVLGKDPNNADALHLYGCLCDDIGRLDDAIRLLAQAVKCNPKAYPYFYNLGNMLAKKGEWAQAAQNYRTAIWHKHDYAVAHNNLGLVLCKLGDRTAGKASFEKALRYRADYADPHYNMGIALKEEGSLKQAVACYLAALQIRPDYPLAHYNLGNAYAALRQPGNAITAYLAALRGRPSSLAYNNLGGELLKLGRVKEAIEAFEMALQMNPVDLLAISNLIAASCYATDNPVEIYKVCKRWVDAARAPSSEKIERWARPRDTGRRLRVGYVSADFRHHAAAYWIEPMLSAHDHSGFTVYCYSNSDMQDAVSDRLQKKVDVWVGCSSLDDNALAQRIRQDEIDILVDLSGHTDGNRLSVFAQKPAPIQISWFGFPVSTGLSAMDYRITDACIDHVGKFDECYSEKLIRLNRFYAAYRPEASAPEIGPSPQQKNGFVTYASVNNLAKVSPIVMKMWAEILRANPTSHLLMQAVGIDDSSVADKLKDFFAARGVAEERLILRGWTSIGDFLDLGNEVDIALDPFPFNGGVTTCHTLWMGLPLVTLRGESAASRVGYSILNAMGLNELVATTPAQYVEIALKLASDCGRLTELRSTMRKRMCDGGLLDGAALTKEVESVYRALWTEWCANRENCTDGEDRTT